MTYKVRGYYANDWKSEEYLDKCQERGIDPDGHYSLVLESAPTRIVNASNLRVEDDYRYINFVFDLIDNYKDWIYLLTHWEGLEIDSLYRNYVRQVYGVNMSRKSCLVAEALGLRNQEMYPWLDFIRVADQGCVTGILNCNRLDEYIKMFGAVDLATILKDYYGPIPPNFVGRSLI